MKKAVALLLVFLLLFTGCVSSENKKAVNDTLERYFTALNSGDFEKANKMTVQAEENISATIKDASGNKLIFNDITYDVWDISQRDGVLIAETVITQKSLKAAYIDTVSEYATYVEDAKSKNKEFTDKALEDKWNEIFYKHVSDTKETVSMKCEIFIAFNDDGSTYIYMTSDFRNCLFGGELDAINSIKEKK